MYIDTEDRKKQIGAMLKKLRKQNHLSQEYVGNLISKSRSAYAQYERGKSTPSHDNLMKLARIYRVPLSVFDENSDILNSDRPEYIEERESNLSFTDLSDTEEELVLIFRSKSRAERQEMINYIRKQQKSTE